MVHDDEESVLRSVKALRNLPKVVFKDSTTPVVGRGGAGSAEVGSVKAKKASSPPVVVVRSPREKVVRVKVEVET